MASAAAAFKAGRTGEQEKEEKDWEDPARCWIDLVEAAKEPKKDVRDQKLKLIFDQAKNSHWTHQEFDNFLEAMSDDEYGGDIIEIPSEPDDWVNPPDSQVEGFVNDFARTKVTARHPFKCGHCGRKFTNERDLVDHISHCY